MIRSLLFLPTKPLSFPLIPWTFDMPFHGWITIPNLKTIMSCLFTFGKWSINNKKNSNNDNNMMNKNFSFFEPLQMRHFSVVTLEGLEWSSNPLFNCEENDTTDTFTKPRDHLCMFHQNLCLYHLPFKPKDDLQSPCLLQTWLPPFPNHCQEQSIILFLLKNQMTNKTLKKFLGKKILASFYRQYWHLHSNCDTIFYPETPKLICQHCGLLGNIALDCQETTCSWCRQTNHIIDTCPELG